MFADCYCGTDSFVESFLLNVGLSVDGKTDPTVVQKCIQMEVMDCLQHRCKTAQMKVERPLCRFGT